MPSRGDLCFRVKMWAVTEDCLAPEGELRTRAGDQQVLSHCPQVSPSTVLGQRPRCLAPEAILGREQDPE